MQAINPAMANAAFNADGGQKAFDTFADALMKFVRAQLSGHHQAGKAVAQELESIDKNSATAKTQFVGWAESMGLSATAANKPLDQGLQGRHAVHRAGGRPGQGVSFGQGPG